MILLPVYWLESPFCRFRFFRLNRLFIRFNLRLFLGNWCRFFLFFQWFFRFLFRFFFGFFRFWSFLNQRRRFYFRRFYFGNRLRFGFFFNFRCRSRLGFFRGKTLFDRLFFACRRFFSGPRTAFAGIFVVSEIFTFSKSTIIGGCSSKLRLLPKNGMSKTHSKTTAMCKATDL